MKTFVPPEGGHAKRVARLVEDLLREMHVWESEARTIVAAARVHDVGKMFLPRQLIMKPAALTPAEWALMQQHADLGARFLYRFPDMRQMSLIVRHHHEAWDGSGYPAKLRGIAIPVGSRVIAVVDSFDAMTSNRPYRLGMSIEQALDILVAGKGMQWDPRIVDSLLRTLQRAEAPRPLRSQDVTTAPALAAS